MNRILACLLLITPLPLHAQILSSDCRTELSVRWNALHNANNPATQEYLRDFFTFNQAPACMSQLVVSALNPNSVAQARIQSELAAAKTKFQQSGASAGSGSTTNLVSKGATAQVLSVAAEYGALTETTSGQSVTLQGQLGGIPTALLNHGLIDNCGGMRLGGAPCVSSPTLNRLNRFSYSVSFDTSTNAQTTTGTVTSATSTSAQPAVFTAAAHTINSVTGKAILVRGPAATPTQMADGLNAAVKASAAKAESENTGAALNAATTNLLKMSDANPVPMDSWTLGTFNLVSTAPTEQAALDLFESRAGALLQAMCASTNPGCTTKLTNVLLNYATAVNSYQAIENSFFENLRKKPVLTAEYDYNRPAGQPTNSTFRLIWGQAIGPSWTFTGNVAASIYDSTPSSLIPGSGLLRDVQLAAEAAYDFSKSKKIPFLGDSALSTAYYFQDQTSPAILNVTPGEPVSGVTFVGLPATATQVYAQKGKIHIVQGKFTYTPGLSNISIPASFTWSNRNELVANANSIWRGQVGISYNFDSLFGKSGK